MHDHLLYLMFRCDFDVMESLESLEEFGGSEHSLAGAVLPCLSMEWTRALACVSVWKLETKEARDHG